MQVAPEPGGLVPDRLPHAQCRSSMMQRLWGITYIITPDRMIFRSFLKQRLGECGVIRAASLLSCFDPVPLKGLPAQPADNMNVQIAIAPGRLRMERPDVTPLQSRRSRRHFRSCAGIRWRNSLSEAAMMLVAGDLTRQLNQIGRRRHVG